jgi:nicotinate-nucleotide adenylyltransferase
MMRKVGLFFGTFDPIHIGHEKIAIYFLERYFDEIWFVITPLNPDKINENLTDQSIRLEMAKNFCDDNEKFKYCDIEFNLPKPNYTADTLVELKNNYPDLNFSIIMGEDNLIGLETWKNYKRILEGKIYVYPRATQQKFDAKLKDHHSVIFSDAPIMKISSSEIRSIIRKEEDYLKLVPSKIHNYISKNNLYR